MAGIESRLTQGLVFVPDLFIIYIGESREEAISHRD